MEQHTTDCIILRKTQFKETSLIISSLSKDYGKLDFIIQGAKKINAKNFPIIDLFRVIKGDFSLKNNGLNKISSPELVDNYDSIVENSNNYMTGCTIAQFVTANTQPMMEMPLLYTALKNALNCLSKDTTSIPWVTMIKLVYLHEEGLLPSILGGENSKESENKKQDILRSILEFACGGDPVDLPESYWIPLTNWVDSLCSYQCIKH